MAPTQPRPTGPMLTCADLKKMINIVLSELANHQGNKSELEALLSSLQATYAGCEENT